MLQKTVRVLQHLKLRQKQIHIVVHRNVTSLPVSEEHPRRQEHKAHDREQKPVFRYPQKPPLLRQSPHISSAAPYTCLWRIFLNTKIFCPKKFITINMHIPRNMATLSTITFGCAASIFSISGCATLNAIR